MNNLYPFTAIVGQERIKKAIILNLINEKIGGVLISGEKGTGKTSLVRASENIGHRKIVNIPLNIKEEALVGSLGLEEVLKTGDKKVDYGLLKRAHENIVYIDEVNLLSENITNIIIETASRGENILERDGISKSHESNFIMIGTMNPEEGALRGQMLDKFGLYVEAEKEEDPDKKVEIIRRRLDFELNPSEFIKKYEEEEKALSEEIKLARQRLRLVKVERSHLEMMAELAILCNLEGHRGDISLLESSRALAAYYGRDRLDQDIIREASLLALPHRMRENLEIELEEIEEKQEEEESLREDESDNLSESLESDLDSQMDQVEESNKLDPEELLEEIEEFKDSLKINIDIKTRKKNEGLGKRIKTRTDTRRGRHIKYRRPKGNCEDLDFNASLKAAALRKGSKKKDNGLALNIEREDIREKLREAKTGATIIFLVDASSSMGARKRMGAVKGAVLSLLTDAYEKRDKIGILAFREDYCQVILETTRSADLAKKHLNEIKTGGQTPLALGLEKAYRYLEKERIKDENALLYLVVVSDCRGNLGLYSKDPMEDAYKIGEKIAGSSIKSLVLDTENSFMNFGFGEELSKSLDGEYLRLNKVDKDEIKSSVVDLIYKK